jgi:CHASE2 domain-containing sensor protein
LVNWCRTANSYPRVNFADVFAAADGGKPMAELPSFAGKIVIIGATAPSLHDIHPTPLSATQAGVESLATGIDNALHRRVMRELPKWAGAVLAIVMCAGIALWSYHRSVSSLAPAMVALPSILLGVSFVSLHTDAAFLDLHLSAGLAVLFLAVLRVWYSMRKRHWCSELPPETGRVAVWAWASSKPWTDDLLDRLMAGLQKSAAHSRLVLLDISPADSNMLKWRPFASCLAIVGPADELENAQLALLQAVHPLSVRTHVLQQVPERGSTEELKRHIAFLALQGWGALQDTDSSLTQETTP